MAVSATPGIAVPGDAWPGYTWSPLFTPPTVKRPLAPDRPEHRPFNRVKYKVGLTVLKDGFGNYRTVENPSEDDINNAAAAYLGGRSYVVSGEEAAGLTAAGYEVTYE